MSRNVEEHPLCLNCGTPLGGAYCHACGQRAHVHRSLWHLVEELLHGVTHFDAKGWRTLPLLVARPGLLTRRYIDGQRTRYVSPLALFLFSMFLFFLVMSATLRTPATASEAERSEARSALTEAAADALADLDEREKELEQARKEGGNVARAEQQLTVARKKKEAIDASLALFMADPQAGAASAPAGPARAASAQAEVNTDWPVLNEAVRRLSANPELALYKLKGSAYKFAFLLIPISLPFLWLMFLGRRGVTLFDHTVFATYSLAFMALLFSACALLESVPPAATAAAWLVVLVPPLHMFWQLREAYALGVGSALWRTVAMSAVTALVLLTYLVLVLALSA